MLPGYTSSCLLDRSLVFLVDYLLCCCYLLARSLILAQAMICLSTEHASSITFSFNFRISLRGCGLGLAILSTLFLRGGPTYVHTCPQRQDKMVKIANKVRFKLLSSVVSDRIIGHKNVGMVPSTDMAQASVQSYS